jgi:hypothetical protein
MTGDDLIQVAKDAREVYRAAKQIAQDLEDEKKVAAEDLKSLRSAYARMEEILEDLPTEMTRAERRRYIAATKAVIEERLKHQDVADDFEERLKLNAQLFTLENQAIKLDLLDQFDVRALVKGVPLNKLIHDVSDAQEQIRRQLTARGYARVGARLAILTIDLGMLVAKAA